MSLNRVRISWSGMFNSVYVVVNFYLSIVLGYSKCSAGSENERLMSAWSTYYQFYH